MKQTLTVNKKKGRQARVGPALSHDDDDVSGKPPAAPRKVRPFFKKKLKNELLFELKFEH